MESGHQKNRKFKHMTEITQEISWTPLLEKYFASVGEKAHCLSWCHNKSAALYSYRRTFIDLPVIIGSGSIAFLTAGSSSLFGDAQMASIALGIGSLVVAMLNTVTTYFGWAKRAEGHRIGALHYAKLYRFLCVEMGLPRDERMRPGDLLKYVREQYDRLAETTPDVPPPIIAEFRRRFSDKKYEDISKPEETNGLEEIIVYRSEKDSEAHLRDLPQSPVPSSGGILHRISVAARPRSPELVLRSTSPSEGSQMPLNTTVAAESRSEQSSQSNLAATV